ncbi:MAG: DNA-binding response regulator [Sphingobacteriia bacterium]|nr:MAG: DNA-binding response regulator [Sphingobacteriia bacterium]TAG30514.1 MAG: DNA-binding response regulator [Sphingobacteriia bacterium]TAH08520.1 MAG: DNA-binding response regulator [Sphingobacteriia bacterium]
MIKIGIVDDHQIVIDGLTALLKDRAEIQIVCTANNGKQMLHLLGQHQIDILLTDMMMPEMSGLQLAVEVKFQHPQVRIIALSMNGEGALVDQMIDQADIAGYLLKQTDVGELVYAIIKVYEGGIYFQEVILNALANHSNLVKEVETIHLTLREKEVINWMERDYSNKQIADELNIAVRTVETHRKNIFRKTGTNNLLSLVKWAYEHQILRK